MYANPDDNAQGSLFGRLQMGLRKTFKGESPVEQFEMVFPGGVRFRKSPTWDDEDSSRTPLWHGETIDGCIVEGSDAIQYIQCDATGLYIPSTTRDKPPKPIMQKASPAVDQRALNGEKASESTSSVLQQLQEKLDIHVLDPVKATIEDLQEPSPTRTSADEARSRDRAETMARRRRALLSGAAAVVATLEEDAVVAEAGSDGQLAASSEIPDAAASGQLKPTEPVVAVNEQVDTWVVGEGAEDSEEDEDRAVIAVQHSSGGLTHAEWIDSIEARLEASVAEIEEGQSAPTQHPCTHSLHSSLIEWMSRLQL